MVGLKPGPLRFFGPQTSQALQLLAQLKARQVDSEADKAMAQSQAIANLLAHSYRYSSFWRARLADAGFDENYPHMFELARLPELTREVVQTQFEGLRARWPSCQPEKIFTVATSGSTGQPVRVEKHSDFYHPLESALALLEMEWFQRDPAKSIAYIGPQLEDKRLPSWGGIYQALGYNGAYYKRNFSDKTVQSHLDWLAEVRPDYLKCSPYLAAQMADMAIEAGQPLQIRQIISVSETVSPRQRQRCFEGLGARIVDRYSSEETGMIALQCPEYNHLHVIDSSVLVEIIDECGNPCPEGVVGKVLLTALHSYAMPIIRYDVGDLAQWGRCDCGRTMPVLERVWGRTRASVVVPGRGSVPMGFIGDDLGKIEAIREFRLRQYQDLALELVLVAARELTGDEIDQIRNYFLSYGLEECLLYWCYAEVIDWPANRKREEFMRVAYPFEPGAEHKKMFRF